MRALRSAFACSATVGSKGSAGRGPQRGPLGLRRLADGGEPASDVAGVVCAVGRLEQRVQLGQALDARDRHEVAPAEAPDLALHTPPFSCAPAMPGSQKNASKPKWRAQRDEAVALDAVAAAQHARDGRAQIVVANAPRHPAEACQQRSDSDPGHCPSADFTVRRLRATGP